MAKIVVHDIPAPGGGTIRAIGKEGAKVKTGDDASCCCGDCFYQIPLCRCETDPEPCPLFILCEIADAFFDQFPEFNDHLVFPLFDQDAKDQTLCYDLIADPAHQVTALPPGACVLDEVPPGFPPEQNACAYCCPSCCPRCRSGPLGDCAPPNCCYNVGDTATFTVDYPAITTTEFCVNDGNTWTMTCPAFHRAEEYEVLDCSETGVVFINVTPDSCLAPVLIMSCCPTPGGLQCDCPILPESCTCFCPVVDPCSLACPSSPPNCCSACPNQGGICCLLPPGPFPVPGPCDSVPLPDFQTNCREFTRVAKLPYTISASSSCGAGGPGCVPTPAGFVPSKTCGCRVTTFHFVGNPSCQEDEKTGICLPP